MKVIPREVRRITYSAKIRELKKRLALSPDQRSLVIGSVLGDGYLEPNWSRTNYRLKVQHSAQQKDYVLWKHSLLSDWALTEPKEQLVNCSIRFRTISHPELTKFRELFYRGNKKIIPEDIAKLLDPFALAVWFMDDGGKLTGKGRLRGYYLNTQSFSENQNKVLVKALSEKLGIKGVSVQANHGYKRLFIGAYGRNRLRELIDPHVIPTMRYKLS